MEGKHVRKTYQATNPNPWLVPMHAGGSDKLVALDAGERGERETNFQSAEVPDTLTLSPFFTQAF